MRVCRIAWDYFVWGSEPENRAQGSFCHHKSGSDGSSRSEYILGLMASRCGNALNRLT
jgi:hypothetical protein